MRADELLGRAKTALPAREARLLLAHVLGVKQEDLWARPEILISQTQAELFKLLLTRRLKGEPLAKIRGFREFWGREFKVSAAVLDPRPDSETLIETALRYFPDRSQPLRILDLGTGSGCLLLSLLGEYPKAWGLGVDLSLEALKIAQANSEGPSACFLQGNWGEALEGQFDLIISNPPYIPSGDIPGLDIGVREYDPLLALDGGKDGLVCYRQIACDLPRLLRPQGIAIFEIGQGQDLSPIFSVREAVPDLGGILRAVVVGHI